MLVQLGKRTGPLGQPPPLSSLPLPVAAEATEDAAAQPDDFLPTTLAEAQARGWSELDVVIVTGDAYVDHPAFGPVLIARILAKQGFRVGILPQPDWRSVEDFRRLGRPRLFFGVSAGNLDSMLNRLTAQKRSRGGDPYTPGGRLGARPERATIVYAHRCREAFPEVPIVLGGLEASLRRMAHYDYWSDTVRRPILVDAKADLLVFGMGERPVCEIAQRLHAGEPIARIRDVRGTAYVTSQAAGETACGKSSRRVGDGLPVVLPAYEALADRSPEALVRYAQMARQVHRETNPSNGRPLVQRVGNRVVYFNSPALPLASAELDALYELPFTRRPHPRYREPVPAYETAKHSLLLMRGCVDGCTCCSITEHTGRITQSRSADSILRELRSLRRQDDFHGVVSDLGGPAAHLYMMRCTDADIESKCRRMSCVHPAICPHLQTDPQPLIGLMRQVRGEPGIRKVSVASSVRSDLARRSSEPPRELAEPPLIGPLPIVPDQVSAEILRLIKSSSATSRESSLLPSYISGHPGSRLEDIIELALHLKRNGLRPRQVQDFIPTPMSLAAAMYYTGLNPLSKDAAAPIYVARGLREKRMQKALLLYWDPAQHELAREALLRAGRPELIGDAEDCLIPPARAPLPSPPRPRPSSAPSSFSSPTPDS